MMSKIRSIFNSLAWLAVLRVIAWEREGVQSSLSIHPAPCDPDQTSPLQDHRQNLPHPLGWVRTLGKLRNVTHTFVIYWLTVYKAIKDLEARLAPTADGKAVVLNSFIMSGSKSSELKLWWSTPEVEADRAYREARNVYTLDNTECVELMIAKILQQ